MSEPRNNWDVGYSSIAWVENALKSNKCVRSFERTNDILFEIVRTDSRPPMKALIVSRYVIGVADVIEAQGEFPGVDCIFTSGEWYGYTRDAKEYGIAQGIAVFRLGEFMAALWRKDFLHYVKKDEKGKPIYEFKDEPPA